MAYDWTGSTSSAYQSGGVVVSSNGISVACWVYPDTGTQSEYFFDAEKSGAIKTLFYHSLVTTFDQSFFQVILREDASQSQHVGTSVQHNSGGNDTTYRTGQWNLVGFTHDGSSDPDQIKVYCNNIAVDMQSGTGTITPDAVPDTVYHTGRSAAGDRGLDGKMGEWAMWNTVLTLAEFQAMYNEGISPLRIRPGNLVNYVPFIRDVTDIVSGNTLTTANGSVTAHNRVTGRGDNIVNTASGFAVTSINSNALVKQAPWTIQGKNMGAR